MSRDEIEKYDTVVTAKTKVILVIKPPSLYIRDKSMQNPPSPLLTVGTDCSGIDSILHALVKMNVPYTQLWYCDILSQALQISIHNGGNPQAIYSDVLARDDNTLPCPDLYAVGCPCQPFSSMGSGKKSNDSRFTVFLKCIDTIATCRPKTFLIENVATVDNESLSKIRNRLMPLQDDYFIDDAVLNSRDYGLPQNRPRLFIIGIQRNNMVGEFKWPDMKPHVGVVEFLGLDRSTNVADTELTPYMQSVIKACSQRVGEHAFNSQPFVCNAGSSCSRLSVMNDICPCLTRRARPYIAGAYKRRLTLDECARIQGFEHLDLSTVSMSSARNLIGNSQPVTVLVAILEKLLPAAGLDFCLNTTAMPKKLP